MRKTLIFSLLLNAAFIMFELYGYFKTDDSKALMDRVAVNKKQVAEEEKVLKERKKEIEKIGNREYEIQFKVEEGVLSWQRK